MMMLYEQKTPVRYWGSTFVLIALKTSQGF